VPPQKSITVEATVQEWLTSKNGLTNTMPKFMEDKLVPVTSFIAFARFSHSPKHPLATRTKRVGISLGSNPL
jgi:hypothetical protein